MLCRASATLLAKTRHAQGISAQLAMWTRPAPCDVTFTSRWRQRSERIEPRTYSADASVDHTSITPTRAMTSLAASVDPTEARNPPNVTRTSTGIHYRKGERIQGSPTLLSKVIERF